jgi:hypothetical protein
MSLTLAIPKLREYYNEMDDAEKMQFDNVLLDV